MPDRFYVYYVQKRCGFAKWIGNWPRFKYQISETSKKTEKGRRSVFYFCVNLVSSHAQDIIDLSPKALMVTSMSCLREED